MGVDRIATSIWTRSLGPARGAPAVSHLHGMTQGVDAALTAMLGKTVLARVAEERRYRRDIY